MTRPPSLLVAQIGARRHYAVPCALARAERLAVLHTDTAAIGPLARLATWSPIRPGPLRRWLGRRPRDVHESDIVTHGLAMARTRLTRRSGSETDKTHHWAAQNRAFGEAVCRSDWRDAGGVYLFNGAALEIAEQARRRGLFVIVDQTIAPQAWVNRRLREERDRFPAWPISFSESADPLAEREQAEFALADAVICGSDFVARTVLEDHPNVRALVVPPGYDRPAIAAPRPRRRHDPLRVLFVGTVGLRKGAPVLQAAAAALGSEAILRAVGPVEAGGPMPDVELVGAVARDALETHYEWADVLVLPSIAEGSANVCFEALARGLPVVCTEESGSVVRDGIEGRLISASDPTALVEVLRSLSTDRIAAMSKAALGRAAKFTWENYGQRLIAAIDSVCGD